MNRSDYSIGQVNGNYYIFQNGSILNQSIGGYLTRQSAEKALADLLTMLERIS